MTEKRESSGAPCKKRPSLSLKRRKGCDSESSAAKRFAISSEEEVEALKAKPMSKNMQRSQTWALNVLKEWLNGDELDMEVDFVEKFQKEKVYDVLHKFITEAKQCSGNRITLRLFYSY